MRPRIVEYLQSQEKQEAARKYFDELELRVHWGNARDFVAELGSRWKKRIGDG